MPAAISLSRDASSVSPKRRSNAYRFECTGIITAVQQPYVIRIAQGQAWEEIITASLG
jgi:hypothetical protein